MTEIELAGSLIIVGAAVSVLMNVLKAAFGSLTGWKTKFVLILISLAIAGIYKYLEAAGLLGSMFVVLTTASTVYAFFYAQKRKTL